MPKRRQYDLAALWVWIYMQDNGVTARAIAEHLGCAAAYVHHRVLADLEESGRLLAYVGQQKTGRRSAAIYEPMRPDEAEREK